MWILNCRSAVLAPLDLARAVNVYIDETAPYKLASQLGGSNRLDTILNLSAEAIYRCLAALVPALPEKAAAGLQQLGMNASELSWERLSTGLPAGLRVADGKPLFQVTEGLTSSSGIVAQS